MFYKAVTDYDRKIGSREQIIRKIILAIRYAFQSIAMESLGLVNEYACKFLFNWGLQVSCLSGDDREANFVFQQLSIFIQRFYAILLHDSFVDEEDNRHSGAVFYGLIIIIAIFAHLPQ